MINEDVLSVTKVALAGFLGATPGESFAAMCKRVGIPKDFQPAAKLGWDLFPWHAKSTLEGADLLRLKRRVERWNAEDWTLEEIYYVIRLCQKGR